ncbi:MAG TPA: metallopeptidase family protein [Ktedonobacteraceae bacterium]|nr:metallopeptidase family protein [Ktedonobacteraceae bacterium]
MSEQDYSEQQVENNPSDEIDNLSHEPEFDEDTLRSNEQRSRFFFVAMSFLIALICLSLYLNHLTDLNSTVLQLGIIVFAAIGLFLLLRGGTTTYKKLHSTGEQDEEQPEHRDREDEIEDEQARSSSLTPFELLVQEALAAIPEEFHERMDNVFVQVEYEPGEELLRRVGTKEGYTLLGLYEGVPLTVYGSQQSAYPETITIFQRTIERYCHGDPDRIREQVQHTVLHEVAHHFGIDHDEMPIWIK